MIAVNYLGLMRKIRGHHGLLHVRYWSYFTHLRRRVYPRLSNIFKGEGRCLRADTDVRLSILLLAQIRYILLDKKIQAYNCQLRSSLRGTNSSASSNFAGRRLIFEAGTGQRTGWQSRMLLMSRGKFRGRPTDRSEPASAPYQIS